MKKALLPLAIASVLPMAAMAEVSIYGQANASLDLLDNGANYSELNVSSNSSRLGFKADREINNLTVMVQIEQQFDIDNSTVFTAPRNTFVGLKGDFGMVRVGRFDSPLNSARGPAASLFADRLGDIRNITSVGEGRFDDRSRNLVHYQTPKLGDVQFNIAYSPSEEHTAQDGASDELISLSVTYGAGPLNLVGAYETFGDDHTNGGRSAIRISGDYAVTSEFKLVGFFQSADHDTTDAASSDVFGIGGAYSLNEKTRLLGQYLIRSADVDDADSNMITVGIEHSLDDAVRLYANYGLVSNDDAIAINPYTTGRTTTNVPQAPGETASGLSAGISYSF